MIACNNAALSYPMGDSTVHVLRRINFTLPGAGLVLVTGEAGSGKTALLRLLSGMETPSRGDILFSGEPASRMSERELAAWRRRCGTADTALLLGERTVRENAILSATAAMGSVREARAAAEEAIALVAMESRADALVSALSTQELSRAALCCAAARAPEILIVDEPEADESLLALLKLWSAERLVIVASRNENLFRAEEDVKLMLSLGELTGSFGEPEEPTESAYAPPTGLGFFGALSMAMGNLTAPFARTATRLGAIFAAVLALCLGLAVLRGGQVRAETIQAETLAAYPIVLTADNVPDGDLDALGRYLESEMDLNQASVQRTWAVSPIIYSISSDGSVRQVTPDAVTGTALWTELPDGDALRESGYTLTAGRWPTRYDEAAVILDARGNIDRACLKALGFADDGASVSYTELMRLSFRVLLPTDKYVQNVDGTWGYIAHDEAVLKTAVQRSLPLNIVGVLRPNTAGSAVGGVGYLSDLTAWVRSSITGHQLVTAQVANPGTDVLTNRPFDANAHATEPVEQLRSLQRYVTVLSSAEQSALCERITGEAVDEAAAQDTLLKMLDMMSADALAELYVQEIESGVSPVTYEENLRSFGALDADTVTGVRVYARDFAYRGDLIRLLGGHSRPVVYADEAEGIIAAGAELLESTARTYPVLGGLLTALALLGLWLSLALPLRCRRREMGVLRALGAASPKSVLIWENLVLALLSSAAGVLLTVALESVTGGEVLGVAVNLHPLWGALAAVLTLVLGITGGASATGSSRQSPLHVIENS